MARGRSTTVGQELEIRYVFMMGIDAPAQVYRHLKQKGLLDGEDRVSEKTISRRIKELRSRDASGPWSVLDADPDDARHVAPVLAWLLDVTGGRVWLSQDLAGWVARVCAFAAMPPNWAWAYAQSYQAAKARGDEDVRCLDLALVSRAWEHPAGAGAVAVAFSPEWQSLGTTCGEVGAGQQWLDLLLGQELLEERHSGLNFDLPPWADDEEEPHQTAVD